MDINDVVRLSNNADLEKLIPIKSIKNPLQYFSIDSTPKLYPNYSQLVKTYGRDIADNCYYSNNFIPELIYFDKNTYVLIEMLGVMFNKTSKETLLKNISQLAADIQEYGLESEEISWKIPSKFYSSLLSYYMKKKKITNYKDFIQLYMHNDYGFEKLNKTDLKNIFDLPHTKIGQSFIDTLPDKVIIYRGVGDKSNSLDNTLSWTLNPQIAYFFAIKNSQNTSYLFTAEVNKMDILDYLDDRYEEEILVYPQHVHIISKDILYSLNDIKTRFETKFVNVQYVLFELTKNYTEFLKTSDFAMNSSLHGLRHMQRVCFLSGLIHEMLRESYHELNDKTLIKVMTAGLLHDVGRANEWNDIGHGKRSSGMYEDYYHSKDTFVQPLIEYHDRDDEEFIEYLSKNQIENRKVMKICYGILKDADALNRLRLGWRDLDTRYLRFAISKNLVFVAKQLLGADFEI